MGNVKAYAVTQCPPGSHTAYVEKNDVSNVPLSHEAIELLHEATVKCYRLDRSQEHTVDETAVLPFNGESFPDCDDCGSG